MRVSPVHNIVVTEAIRLGNFKTVLYFSNDFPKELYDIPNVFFTVTTLPQYVMLGDFDMVVIDLDKITLDLTKWCYSRTNFILVLKAKERKHKWGIAPSSIEWHYYEFTGIGLDIFSLAKGEDRYLLVSQLVTSKALETAPNHLFEQIVELIDELPNEGEANKSLKASSAQIRDILGRPGCCQEGLKSRLIHYWEKHTANY